MTKHEKCPKCGALLPENAPGGICPKCLMAAGLATSGEQQDRHKSDREAPTVDSPSPGRGFLPPLPSELADRFPQLEILELLGHGGMGAVYMARQKKLDRLVALKIIRPEATHDRTFAERFNREAKTLARLSHQQIVAVHDFGEVDFSGATDQPARPLYYFLMEYVEGANLRQLLRAGELAPEQALAIVPQICDALQYAHDEGVVHRDIKPENILLNKRGRVKIADFGLAKLANHSEEEFTLTGTHQVMGTLRYMAPEQLESTHAVDHRADIYSLGVVFYEMLTGEAPMGHFEPPSKKVEVDVRLDEVVLRSLAREPDRRYQHASDVKTDVESITRSARQGETSRPLPPNPTSSVRGDVESMTDPSPPTARPFDQSIHTGRRDSDMPQFSRKAVVGALFAALSVLTPIATGAIISAGLVKYPEAAVVATVLLISFLSAVASCLLGVVAINDIRQSQGRVAGLGLAFFDAVFLPLLALDGVILGVLYLIEQATHWPDKWWPLIVAAICAPLDVWIVARGWRSIRYEVGADSKPQNFAADRNDAAPRPPFGFVFAVIGLFLLAWVIAGGLRSFGPLGLAAAIGVMMLVTFGLVRWKLEYLPTLRAEISQQPPWRRYAASAAGALLFVLSMLAVEVALTGALDTLYLVRLGDQPGPFSTAAQWNIIGQEINLDIPESLQDDLDRHNRFHNQDPDIVLQDAVLIAVVALVLLLAAIAAVLGTRRFQYQWAHHLRPTCYFATLAAATLPIVVIGHMALRENTGWGISTPYAFSCSLTQEDYEAKLENWAVENRYRITGNGASGTYGPVHFRSFWLTPARSTDRWQFSRDYAYRPVSPFSISWLKHDSDPNATLLIEFPWDAIGTPEEKLRRPAVESLYAAVGAETDSK